MSHVLCVRWTIVPRTAPQPWRHCSRCGGARRFRTGGKTRVNANGKLVDAWLVYRCTVCDGTWNRPILERRPLRAIDPDVLGAPMANDPKPPRRLEVLCSVPKPTGLRLDRLLGNELRVSRSFIRRLESRGDLVVLPPGSRLHRPVREGTRVVVTLSALGDVGTSIAANARDFPTRPDFQTRPDFPTRRCRETAGEKPFRARV